jgi:Helix-turn-helix domain
MLGGDRTDDHGDDDSLISTAEAARYLGLRFGTLVDWRRRGYGPPYFIVGPKAVRYSLRCLAAWRDRGRVIPTESPQGGGRR